MNLSKLEQILGRTVISRVVFTWPERSDVVGPWPAAGGAILPLGLTIMRARSVR